MNEPTASSGRPWKKARTSDFSYYFVVNLVAMLLLVHSYRLISGTLDRRSHSQPVRVIHRRIEPHCNKGLLCLSAPEFEAFEQIETFAG
jgi:hypothetical protein